VWRERRGLGFEIGVVLLRMRGFRVLRNAMAVDRGALQWSGLGGRSGRGDLLATGLWTRLGGFVWAKFAHGHR
jgi:hypothetical protein